MNGLTQQCRYFHNPCYSLVTLSHSVRAVSDSLRVDLLVCPFLPCHASSRTELVSGLASFPQRRHEVCEPEVARGYKLLCVFPLLAPAGTLFLANDGATDRGNVSLLLPV